MIAYIYGDLWLVVSRQQFTHILLLLFLLISQFPLLHLTHLITITIFNVYGHDRSLVLKQTLAKCTLPHPNPFFIYLDVFNHQQVFTIQSIFYSTVLDAFGVLINRLLSSTYVFIIYPKLLYEMICCYYFC